jgi:hypothetical protein
LAIYEAKPENKVEVHSQGRGLNFSGYDGMPNTNESGKFKDHALFNF